MMKKINHFSFNQIVRKRTLNSTYRQLDLRNKNQKRKSGNYNHEEQNGINQNQIIMTIIEQFNSCPKNGIPTFQNEIKVHLIQLISKKLNLSLNTSKMLPKIKIKKAQHIHIIDKKTVFNNNNKKNEISSLTGSKKLDLTHKSSTKSNNSSMQSLLNTKKYSYFVLTGHIHIYQKQIQRPNDQLNKKQSNNEELSNQTLFYNWKQFQLQCPQFNRKMSYAQFMGFGNVFFLKPQYQLDNDQKQLTIEKSIPLNRSNTTLKVPELLIAEQSIFIQIQNPQYEDEYINHAGMQYDKISSIIKNFSIFSSLGRKIKNFVQFFQFKEYQRNQQIYSIGDPIHKFYLIVKGQMVFQHNKSNPISTAVTSPQCSRKNSLQMKLTIKTQTLCSGNYFGQEEMIYLSKERLLSAKCKSPKCQILQITRQRFEKMLQYSDFYDIVKKSAQIKSKQRLSKLEKSKQIRNKFAFTQFNEEKTQQLTLSTQRPAQAKDATFFNTPKASLDGKYKVMHGNVIRQFSKQQKQKMSQIVNFSMLKVNPDMYEKTIDKFRKYNLKPKQKYKPEFNWELKRVWKVLNLQNVLRQQAQVKSPQGRKYYDSHKRYIYHISESKSLRPKTSSSNYRTKLQYIAYLQQFKSQKN